LIDLKSGGGFSLCRFFHFAGGLVLWWIEPHRVAHGAGQLPENMLEPDVISLLGLRLRKQN
jgi:hypothetical protein